MFNINSYGVDILVNGKPIAQNRFEGKTYIEAKEGSEYEIKIQNNESGRILAVVSVDSLDVLTGKPATHDTGYIISGYDSYRVKGFRYSNDEVGAFKFVKKNNCYAASKGHKANCGVIGIRLYAEFQEPILNDYIKPSKPWPIKKPFVPYDSPWRKAPEPFSPGWEIICGGSTVDEANSYHSGGPQFLNSSVRCCNFSEQPEPKGFDLGSDWGTKKESKVTSVEFKKGNLVFSLDLFYASRESLIEMGVLPKKNQIVFPKAFKEEFATPPKNWRG